MAEGKKARKYDRNRKSGQNQAYQRDGRAQKSKARRLAAHLTRFPEDASAAVAYKATGRSDNAVLLAAAKAKAEYDAAWTAGRRRMPVRPMLTGRAAGEMYAAGGVTR